MSDNNGCGMPLAMLLALAILIGAVFIGGPVISGSGLSWDNSATIAHTNARLEAERLRQSQETARVREREQTARITSDNMMTTIQWLAVAGALVGAVFVAGWATQRSVSAWAARPHRPAAPPATIVMLAAPTLAAAPEARLEWSEEDDAWAIVNDRTQTIKLLEDHSAAPRRLT